MVKPEKLIGADPNSHLDDVDFEPARLMQVKKITQMLVGFLKCIGGFSTIIDVLKSSISFNAGIHVLLHERAKNTGGSTQSLCLP